MSLSNEHRRYLLVNQMAVPAIFNVVLNGLLAWLILRHNAFLTLWGEGAVGPDLLLTAFLLSFLSCLIVTKLINREITHGKVSRLASDQISDSGWHTRSALARASLLGLAGVLLAAAPAVAALSWAGAEPMTVPWFVGFKAVWCGLLAAAISPLIAWWALSAAASPVPSESIAPSPLPRRPM